MFQIKARDKINKFNFVKKIVNIIFLLILSVITTSLLFAFLITGNKYLVFINVLFSSLAIPGYFLIQSIWTTLYKDYLWRKTKYEFLEIVHKTKIPEKNNKVVFVYTTHDDFFESRFLQVTKQTYKNIEYWISDGSEKKHNIKRVEEFAKKHNINYFSLGRPSINKGDNLNTFILKSGAKFDYIVIMDADVHVDNNFVETSLKLFNSENNKSKKLGYISPCVFNYGSKSLFSNWGRNFFGVFQCLAEQIRFFSPFDRTELFGACAIIKKEMLVDINKNKKPLFPEGCLEDVYTSLFGCKQGWNGVINVLSNCSEMFDRTIFALHKRLLRIYDWTVKYTKENKFKNYQERYENREIIDFLIVILPIILIFVILVVLPAVSSLFLIFFSETISSIYLWLPQLVYLSVITISFLFYYLYFNHYSQKGIVYRICSLITFFLIIITLLPEYVKHFINSYFFSKYSDFTPSIKTEKQAQNEKKLIYLLRFKILLVIVTSILIFLLVFFGIKSGMFINPKQNILFCVLFWIAIYPLGFMWLSSIAYIILAITSKIISNPNYNDEDELKNICLESMKFEKTINKFYLDHPEIKKSERLIKYE